MTTLEQREECLRKRSEKGPFPGVGCPPDAKPASPGAAGKAVDQNRLKPCREGRSGYTTSWNRKSKWKSRVKTRSAPRGTSCGCV